MAEHGNYSTYVNHKCRCDACRAAHSAWQRQRRAQRIVEADSYTLAHGTHNTYTNWGCRCDDCRAGHAAYFRRYRRRTRG